MLGSAPRSGNGAEGQVQGERNLSSSEQMEIQRISTIQISKAGCAQANNPVDRARYPLQCNVFPLRLVFEVIFWFCCLYDDIYYSFDEFCTNV